MICTSVIPCLSCDLGKNNKIMSYFPGFFGHFESLAFFESGRTNLTPKHSNRMFLVNFSKVQQLSENFSKKCSYFNLNFRV